MLRNLIIGKPDPEQERARHRLHCALDENKRVMGRAYTQNLDNIEQSHSTVKMVETMLQRMEQRKDASH